MMDHLTRLLVGSNPKLYALSLVKTETYSPVGIVNLLEQITDLMWIYDYEDNEYIPGKTVQELEEHEPFVIEMLMENVATRPHNNDFDILYITDGTRDKIIEYMKANGKIE